MTLKRRATVKIRRSDQWVVKPEAEELEGRSFLFTEGWVITEDDSTIYIGETAWIIDRSEWDGIEDDAPIWIASGDLIFEDDVAG